MDQAMWDHQSSMSSFQRQVIGDQVLGEMYGDKTRGHRELTSAGVTARPITAENVAGKGPGLALISVLIMLPLVMSVYASFMG